MNRLAATLVATRAAADECVIGRRTLLLSLLAGPVVAGCSTMKVTEFKVRGTETYPLARQDQGLFVAVHAVTDPKELEETFNENLLSHGIVPVLVVAENRSATTNFIVARNNVQVVKRDTADRITVGRGGVASEETGTGMMSAATGLILLTSVITSLVALPLIIGGMKQVSDAQVVEHNLGVKEFFSRTIAPGQRAFGYLYLRLPESPRTPESPRMPEPPRMPESNRPPAQYNVVLQAANAETGETVQFNLPLPDLRQPAAE